MNNLNIYYIFAGMTESGEDAYCGAGGMNQYTGRFTNLVNAYKKLEENRYLNWAHAAIVTADGDLQKVAELVTDIKSDTERGSGALMKTIWRFQDGNELIVEEFRGAVQYFPGNRYG